MIQASPQPDALLGRMASLADSTRLRLLRLLEKHELGVVDLCEVLQMPQSTVSRHLKVLTDQGWTVSRRQGTTNLYYMIGDELDPAARRLWDLAREQTDAWATLEQDALRLDRRLREHRRDAEAFFAGAAGEWDRLREEMYGRAFTWQGIAALVPGDWVVADLGCGTGRTAEELSAHVGQVIAVDNNAAMLKAARKRLAHRANVDLRRGDLHELPIDDSACDAAVIMLVLTYTAEPETVLAEMGRVVKPGGRGVVIDLLRHDRDDFRRQMGQQSNGYEPQELAGLLSDAGFVDVSARTLPPEPKAKGPALLLGAGTRAP